ncbi:MAG: amylo-alpha-1,6-glucosidase [Lachnospiraceae bacterium]|nr:amylo-alpha-1,6-glucosidase [Lachnospiraceae bacterium]
MRYLGRECFRNYKEAIRREWVITNGLGSYAGSSIVGANTRKHHGLFIASLHAPTERKVLVNGLYETVCFEDKIIDLYSGKKKNQASREGYLYQTGFCLDVVPSFIYEVEGLFIKKTIAYEWEKNTVAVLYEINNEGRDCVLLLNPVINYRDHNDGSKKSDLGFDYNIEKNTLKFVPEKNKDLILSLFSSEGSLEVVPVSERFDTNIELQTEIDNGMSSSDIGYCPVRIQIGIQSGVTKNVSIVFSIEEQYEQNAEKTIKPARERIGNIMKTAAVSDEFTKDLIEASDKFVVRRESTKGKTVLAGLPWFTDWGRDTMIAFTGLTLVTKRFEDAKSILETFAKYENKGLIPNMFPDTGVEPLYNTVDASLWFFYCIYKYLEYDKSEDAKDFVKDKLYSTMKNIIRCYKSGTDFSIKMDTDGLITAGSDLDQVTWMDVRVGDRVMTPRHGKPVEINALWYNALMITAKLADIFKDSAFSEELKGLASLVKKSFCEKFYNKSTDCLFDVVDEILPDGSKRNDEKIRPNQIFAVSLPYQILDEIKEKSIVNVVRSKLYTDFGIRSLAPEDPEYHGLYKGELAKRDEAYHQGTAWGFLMGPFITAYLKVNASDPKAKEKAEKLLWPIKQHLNDGCIGGIAEVFDGDPPHISGGCYSQAWSVGEILRAVYEGGLSV